MIWFYRGEIPSSTRIPAVKHFGDVGLKQTCFSVYSMAPKLIPQGL